MADSGEQTFSGRALVIGAAVVAVLVTVTGLLLGPGLRERVRQEQSPRTLREPIAAGTHQGHAWEAVGRFDGTANCVELRYRKRVLDRACDTGPTRVTTRIPPAGPTIAYGTAEESRTSIDLTLADGGRFSVPVRAGDLGFPVGFWAVELPPGTVLARSRG